MNRALWAVVISGSRVASFSDCGDEVKIELMIHNMQCSLTAAVGGDPMPALSLPLSEVVLPATSWKPAGVTSSAGKQLMAHWQQIFTHIGCQSTNQREFQLKALCYVATIVCIHII